MTEKSGLSLRDALIWKRNEVVSVSEFVMALQSWEKISERGAFTQLNMLIASGLPIYDHSKILTGEIKVPSHLAIISISAQMMDIELQEVDGEKPPAFSNLRINRNEAFNLFAQYGIKEPYPWPYPPGFPKFGLTEIVEASTIDAPIHGNTIKNTLTRYQTLEACFAVLAAYPNECRDKSGKVVATKLCRCLDKNAAKFWPEECVPPLEVDTIERQIRDVLNRLG